MLDLLAQLAVNDSVSWTNVSWTRAVIAPVTALTLVWLLFSILDRIDPRASNMTARRSRLLTTTAFVVPFLCWLSQYLFFWPMVSMNDTAWILGDPVGAAVQHPLSYNILLTTIVDIGTMIGSNYLTGVVFASVLQLTVWAVLVALIVHYLIRIGTHRIAVWLLITYVSFIPLIGNYSFALVKDAVFSMFLVALVPVLLELQRTQGRSLRNFWVFAGATVALTGFAVMRNNGLVVVALVLVIVIAIARDHRGIAALLAAVTITLALVPTVLTTWKFPQPKSVEWVGIPLQQLGYTNVHNPECVPSEERDFLENVMPTNDWASAWVPQSVDPTKDAASFNRSFLQNNLGAFVRTWFTTGLSCPAEFTAGYLLHSSQLWRLDAATAGATGGQSYFTSVVSNHPANREGLIVEYSAKGISNSSMWPESLDAFLDSYFVGGMKLTPGAGTWLWIMLFSIAGFIYRRRNEWIAIYTPSLFIWITLLAAAPAVFPFRYVQFAMLVVPIGLVILLGTPAVSTRGQERVSNKGYAGSRTLYGHGENSRITHQGRRRA